MNTASAAEPTTPQPTPSEEDDIELEIADWIDEQIAIQSSPSSSPPGGNKRSIALK